jgi:hypothetical protein
MSTRPTLHAVTDVVAGSYKVRVADKRCGNMSSAADANLVDDAHAANH